MRRYSCSFWGGFPQPPQKNKSSEKSKFCALIHAIRMEIREQLVSLTARIYKKEKENAGFSQIFYWFLCFLVRERMPRA